VLVTHDTEFSRRRRKNVVGHHVWLRCLEWDAAALLLSYLPDIAPLISAHDDLFIVVSAGKVEYSRRWE
jgi:hypothetical protein